MLRNGENIVDIRAIEVIQARKKNLKNAVSWDFSTMRASVASVNFKFSAFNKKRIGYKDTSSSKLSKKLQKTAVF